MDKNRIFEGVIVGAKEVMRHRSQLNKINVFPVADGDTGSNLYSTMKSIVNYSEERDSLKLTLESVAEAALIGARGNSGIIFAQYFQGFYEGIDSDEMTSQSFILACNSAMRCAYNAVEEPVEGTILTIMRVFHDTLTEYKFENIEYGLEKAYNKVLSAVDKTTEQIKELKKASVVDSGAKGFQIFLKGFISGLKGQGFIDEVEIVPELDFKHEEMSKYRYCTEAMIKCSQSDLRSLLYSYGDSLIIAGSKTTTRIHLHTDEPSKVFEILSNKGVLIEQKVEDMQKQLDVVSNQKYRRVILTDSVADIPRKLIDEEQVQVIHLSLLIGEESYIDKLTIENEKVLRESSKKPTSTLPSEKQVINMYEYLSTYYDEIIVLCVSKALSGTYQLMSRLSNSYGHIHVIDTKQNSVAQGVIVNQCIEYIKSGRSTDDILEMINEDIRKSKILVKVDSIDPMIQSGRLSVKLGGIIRHIGFKPIVTLKDGKGSLESIGFSKRNAFSRIVNHVLSINRSSSFKKFAICYVDDITEANELKQILESKQIKVDYLVKSSAIIANGAGKGAIAIGYIKE